MYRSRAPPSRTEIATSARQWPANTRWWRREATKERSGAERAVEQWSPRCCALAACAGLPTAHLRTPPPRTPCSRRQPPPPVLITRKLWQVLSYIRLAAKLEGGVAHALDWNVFKAVCVPLAAASTALGAQAQAPHTQQSSHHIHACSSHGRREGAILEPSAGSEAGRPNGRGRARRGSVRIASTSRAGHSGPATRCNTHHKPEKQGQRASGRCRERGTSAVLRYTVLCCMQVVLTEQRAERRRGCAGVQAQQGPGSRPVITIHAYAMHKPCTAHATPAKGYGIVGGFISPWPALKPAGSEAAGKRARRPNWPRQPGRRRRRRWRSRDARCRSRAGPGRRSRGLATR